MAGPRCLRYDSYFSTGSVGEEIPIIPSGAGTGTRRSTGTRRYRIETTGKK